MKIVGISGKAQSGKSTLTEYLTEKYGYEEYSFAGPLKQILLHLGFEHEELYGTGQQKLVKNKHWGYSGREAMQKIGTELFRESLPKILPKMERIWIRLFEIDCEEKGDKNYILSDIRRLDEADAIRKLGGVIIRTVKTVNDFNEKYRQHSSETEIDQIVPDFILDNDKNSIESARKTIDEYLGSIQEDRLGLKTI